MRIPPYFIFIRGRKMPSPLPTIVSTSSMSTPKLVAPLSLLIKVLNMSDERYAAENLDSFLNEHIVLANTIWEKRELQTII